MGFGIQLCGRSVQALLEAARFSPNGAHKDDIRQIDGGAKSYSMNSLASSTVFQSFQRFDLTSQL